MKFWNNLDIRNWRYDGRQLTNPFLIVWKLVWIMPLYASAILAGILTAIFKLDISEIKTVWSKLIYEMH